jgi:thioesterase-3
MSILTSEARIRFQDCDPFQHLNNARYIDYFLNARGDQIWKNYKIDIYGSQGFSWVVGSNQIAYFKPALLNEKIYIETQVIEFSARIIKVEMRMYAAKDNSLKALLWVDSIPINLQTMRLDAHSPQLMEVFSKAVLPIEEKIFEDRKKAVLKKNVS